MGDIIMKTVKVFIEKSEYGYSAYMDDTPLDYSCIGEGKTVRETINDFKESYNEMKEFFLSSGKEFEEVSFEFYYDIPSFLQEYVKAFSLAGLERITGVNQKQLGHYLNGQSKPTKRTIDKIKSGVEEFVEELESVRFA